MIGIKRIICLFFISIACFLLTTTVDASSINNGSVRFDVKKRQGIYDPENLEVEVDPGPSPKTSGDLRIDFVPTFDFFVNRSIKKEEIVYGNAQLFHGSTAPRGNYIQITDEREKKSGWLLQMRQEYQFENSQKNVLKGAELRLDDSWVNSKSGLNESPLVSKDVICVSNIGQTYNLAEAKPDSGYGTWHIIFGSAGTNPINTKNTLAPRLDSNGAVIRSTEYNQKPIYLNQSLQLFLPESVFKETESDYQTMITWILSELP